MKNMLRLLLLCLLPTGVRSQNSATPGKWWVEFTDKTDSPYCLCRPAEFLSARSLERRARAGIPLAESDLPVNPAYLHGLAQSGASPHTTSRWLNGAAVIADSAAILRVRELPYVKEVRYIGRDIRVRNPPDRPAKKRVPLKERPVAGDGSSVFGYAGLQNSLLGIPTLHAAGYRGAGIWVAVLDGGFVNADTLPFFDSIAVQGRLFQGHDFVEHDGAVFESAMHGTSVLSVMGSNLPGYFVGTAPEATYLLVKTEDTGGEYPVEETNWIAGAEWADSIGADIINASLGYTVFNDTTLSHRYAELDGRSSLGARGASIAATKGMIICNSAGNSGDEAWTYIGVPADAPGVVAVGAVDYEGAKAGFSSIGPTADGRIKPDLVAPGDRVVVAGNTGVDLGLSSGTSLASPLLSGALASLWSAFPEKTADEILEQVFRAADQADAPDNLRGYGLPDVTKAWLALSGYAQGDHLNDARGGLFACDQAGGALSLLIPAPEGENLQGFTCSDVLGNSVEGIRMTDIRRFSLLSLRFAYPPGFPFGWYKLHLFFDHQTIELAVCIW